MKSKIYTKTGDKGKTSLFGGVRVPKNNIRIEAYGTVDELNSIVGIVLSLNPAKEILQILIEIQNQLFILGADLATPVSNKNFVPRIGKSEITKIEDWIDKYDSKLTPLKKFILPSGTQSSGFLHLARAVARRAERIVVSLMQKEEIGDSIIIYLNRLNDLFFVLARYENKIKKNKEIFWAQKGKKK